MTDQIWRAPSCDKSPKTFPEMIGKSHLSVWWWCGSSVFPWNAHDKVSWLLVCVEIMSVIWSSGLKLCCRIVNSSIMLSLLLSISTGEKTDTFQCSFKITESFVINTELVGLCGIIWMHFFFMKPKCGSVNLNVGKSQNVWKFWPVICTQHQHGKG